MTLRDEPEHHELGARTLLHRGWVWNLVDDEVHYGDATMHREYVDHTSAVAVLAINERDEVLLISQYRHPVRARNWEIPAGLLDGGPDESPLVAAQRELAEEAQLEADRWWLLHDFWNSPGGSNESIRIFLARDLRTSPLEFDRKLEEADIETRWVALDDAVDAVLAGDLHNPALLQALLVANESRRRGWANLRDAATPWPTRSPGPEVTPRALEGGRRA
ncbi:NUDIX domain-containing protein [Gulosibacter faecalis]|uniref:NUDIX domain-containing protein n=1 Tax=Gulosibacter faecalis TaxID=272240 RepID=A0ABW5V0Y5_9MICO|nr:NUDIX hydrolase [Gulosibacter faecalis]